MCVSGSVAGVSTDVRSCLCLRDDLPMLTQLYESQIAGPGRAAVYERCAGAPRGGRRPGTVYTCRRGGAFAGAIECVSTRLTSSGAPAASTVSRSPAPGDVARLAAAGLLNEVALHIGVQRADVMAA
jgi:hypothetical protein